VGAFFIAACHLGATFAAEVDAVFDGDTIKLKDQRIIRLIGIDTPELGHKGKASEAYARASKNRLAALIRNSDYEVRLGYDLQQEDRYHRTLAYLTLKNGDDPAEILLREGLATTLVIPPNTTRTKDYAKAEATARRKGLKIWAEADKQPIQASSLTGKETGYRIIHGTVSKLRSTRYNHWINLDNKLTVKLTRRDAENYFPKTLVNKLLGSRIEVKGDLYRYQRQHRLRLRHSANFALLP